VCTYGAIVGGLAFDGSGHLVANVGGTIDQINPTTVAVLHSASLPGADGLTYDSFTGKLYDASYGGNAIDSVDPSTLAVNLLANVNGPDGLTSDDKGHVYIESYNLQQVFKYDFGTATPESKYGRARPR
jgi:hypothetical protein